MRFLYHARPQDMRGQVLYPLSALKAKIPEVYEIERAKYEGREALLELGIPILGVLWNEALHLCPLHPSRLAAAWRAVGLSTSAWERDFFEIPVERIDASRAVVFARGALVGGDLPVDEVERFDPATHRAITEPPSEYHEYLIARRDAGRPVRPFAFLPHVLVAAPIDVCDANVVRIDPPT